MADQLTIMVVAVIIAAGMMIVSADPISNFVDRHPTIKMLALSFLLLSRANKTARSRCGQDGPRFGRFGLS